MSRRKYVVPNMEVLDPLIKKTCRSYVVFAEKMGRGDYPTWVSNWKRKDKGGKWKPKNLPSPEEAARMCAILQVEPEEILTEPSDIELVRSLIEQERGIKKDPTFDGEAFDEDTREIIEFLKHGSKSERDAVHAYVTVMKSKRQNDAGSDDL